MVGADLHLEGLANQRRGRADVCSKVNPVCFLQENLFHLSQSSCCELNADPSNDVAVIFQILFQHLARHNPLTLTMLLDVSCAPES